MRFLVAAVCVVTLACDGIQFAAIQVAPQPAAVSDSTIQRAFAAVSRIGTSHGLVLDRAPTDPEGWRECLSRDTLFVCGKIVGGEPQFQVRQWASLSADALMIKREILDSLRREFGEPNVQECQWKVQRPLSSSGCSPLLRGEPTPPAKRE
jgi:hypothetical protein